MIDLKKMLTLLVCCWACLTVATTARAEFVGVVSEFKLDAETADLCGQANEDFVPFPLTVCNVFIQFDEDDDRLLLVAFADVQVMNGGVPGVFYHHTFGQDRPYSCGDLRPFPDLICDSYVAFGEKCEGIGSVRLGPPFDTGEFNNNSLTATFTVQPRGDKCTGKVAYDLNGETGELEVKGNREQPGEKEKEGQ